MTNEQMSSDEDEFFDAPEALGCGFGYRSWGDKYVVSPIPHSVCLRRNVNDFTSPTSKIRQSEVEITTLPDEKDVHTQNQELLQRISLYSKPDFGFFGSPQEKPSLLPYVNVPEPSITSHLSLLHSENAQKQLMKTQFAQTQTIFLESGSLQYPSECTFRTPMDSGLYGYSNAAPNDAPSAYRFVPSVINEGIASHLPEIPDCSLTENSNLPVIQLLRPQVISSAPEVSNRHEDAKNLLEYVKSWSLDAARQQNSGLSGASVNGTVTLDRIASNNLPAYQTGQVDSNTVSSLYDTAYNRLRFESMFPQSTTANITCGRTDELLHPCLHRSSRLVSTSVQTELNLSESQYGNEETLLNGSKFRNTVTLMNRPTIDCDNITKSGDKIVKSSSATLNNEKQLVNPIEMQFRDRTRSNSSLPYTPLSEETNDFSILSQQNSIGVMGKMMKIQKYFRGAVSAMKSATKNKIFNPDEESSEEDEEVIGNQGIRLRSSRQARGRREFLQIKLVQEMKNEHTGAIWAMRFSPCGRLLATAGYDRNIRIWVLRQCYRYFKGMQRNSTPPPSNTKYGSANTFMTSSLNIPNNNAVSNVMMDDENRLDTLSLASTSVSTSGKTDFSEADGASSSSSAPGCSALLGGTDDLPSPLLSTGSTKNNRFQHQLATPVMTTTLSVVSDSQRERKTVFRSKPLLVLRGHEGVVTELAWSKNLFLLATSMDHQVRLWHISRRECLCVFSHNDTVPTIVFHPKDDRYFLSGSLDGKLRLWNIPDKKVRFWVEVPVPSALPVSTTALSSSSSSSSNTVTSLFTRSIPYSGSQYSTSVMSLSKGVVGPKTVITCAAFACEGTKVIVGTYDGRVLFFNSELSYITFITIKSGTTKGRHCRVTAIECDPSDSNKILVTSNDSRLRLVDARDYHTLCKYRGFVNETSQIRASFSPTGRYLISGSENAFFYIWQKSLDVDRVSRFSRVRKDRNNCWEAIKAHDTMVTVAVFSPNPNLVLDKHYFEPKTRSSFIVSSHSEGSNGSCYHHHKPLWSNQLPFSEDRRTWTYLGEVVVSADCNGCIRVFKKYSTETTQSISS
ncbi:unnamed protein product [Heterobilharzia americana]|nr:unnamed protein product [Heterobilharzia americana]